MGSHYYATYRGNRLLGLFTSEDNAASHGYTVAERIGEPESLYHTVKVWIGAEVKAVGTAQPLVP